MIVIYRAEKKFWKRRLILSSRIVLEARIYELRIHTLESTNFVKYIKGCLPRRRLDKDILCYPPPCPSPFLFSLFNPRGCLARRNATCSFVFVVVSHGRRRAGNVAHRSFASTVNNGIFVLAAASIGCPAASCSVLHNMYVKSFRYI